MIHPRTLVVTAMCLLLWCDSTVSQVLPWLQMNHPLEGLFASDWEDFSSESAQLNTEANGPRGRDESRPYKRKLMEDEP